MRKKSKNYSILKWYVLKLNIVELTLVSLICVLVFCKVSRAYNGHSINFDKLTVQRWVLWKINIIS